MSFSFSLRALGLLTILFAAHPAHAADRIFINNTEGAIWHAPANWIGGVPGLGDTARIGVSNLVENSHMRLDQAAVVSGIEVTDGMTLLNVSPDGSVIAPITVYGDTLVSGANGTVMGPARSTIRLFRGDGLYDFYGSRLSLQSGAELDMRNGALVWIDDELAIATAGSRIEGRGAILLNGAGVTFSNSGELDPRGEMGLSLYQVGDGLYDLDGDDAVRAAP